MMMVTPIANLSIPFQNTRSPDIHPLTKELLASRLWALQVGFTATHSLNNQCCTGAESRSGAGVDIL